MWRISVSLILLVSVTSHAEKLSVCQNPEYWCTSSETAKLCGVTDYCKLKEKEIGVDPTLGVTLYMESLCPDCKRFILFQLYPAFKKLYSTGIFDLRIVPYGNAREIKMKNKWVYNCQHGPHECYGNLIETCAIHHLKDMKLIMPFIYCMEFEGPSKATAIKCAGRQKIDYSPIDKCVNSDEGNALEHQMAMETEKLQPQHTYVPWVTINGHHTEEMETQLEHDMAKYLCNIYKGKKPKECSDV